MNNSQEASSHTSETVPASTAAVFRLPRVLKVLFSVVVLLDLIAPFVAKTYGVDGHYHLIWLRQFTQLVSQGILIPRWAPDGFYGFGASTFYFYPPLTYYVASIIRILSGATDPRVLYQMTGLVATIASFFSARVLIRSLGGNRNQASIGAALYATAPFSMAELYSRSSLSSHVGYVFIPLVWAGAVAVFQNNPKLRTRGIVLLAVSSALLVYSSVPLMLLTGVCILIAAFIVWKQLTLRAFIAFGYAALLTLALVALQITSILSAGPHAQLGVLSVTDQEFVLTDLLHGINLPAVYQLAILYAGVVAIAIAYGKSRPLLPRSGPETMIARIGLALTVLIVFLEVPFLSLWVWQHIPPFPLIQGGWRFYTQIVLFGAVIVGVARTPPMLRAGRAVIWIWVLGAIVPAFLLVSNLHVFTHANVSGGEPGEYLPKYTVSPHHIEVLQDHQSDPAVMGDLSSGSLTVREISRSNTQEYDARLPVVASITFHRFYWPFWHLYVNGREIPSRPDSIGRATAMLPAGAYTLRCQLERTPLEEAGLWISGFAWGGVMLASGIGLVRRRVREKPLT